MYAGLFDDIHEEHPNVFKKLPDSLHLFLKLENCQSTGSFKIRGVASQLDAAKRILEIEGKHDIKNMKLITMSAGTKICIFYEPILTFNISMITFKMLFLALVLYKHFNDRKLRKGFCICFKKVGPQSLHCCHAGIRTSK